MHAEANRAYLLVAVGNSIHQLLEGAASVVLCQSSTVGEQCFDAIWHALCMVHDQKNGPLHCVYLHH